MAALPAEYARILVVDDDHDLRRMLALAFTEEGYDVRAVSNGQEALDLLDAWRPRVIVLDLMMPNLDGWAFRSRQLGTAGAEDVPVVVLSASRDTDFSVLKPAAVVPKPFDLDLLLDTVAALAR